MKGGIAANEEKNPNINLGEKGTLLSFSVKMN